MRILIIEDDTTLASLLAANLSNLGHTASCAASGEEGLRLAAESPPDLIVLDIMMPGMDGWEVCRRLRQASDVPVLVLTAKGSQEDVLLGLQLGADDYVRKPFDLRELELRIEALLRRSGRRDEDGADFDDGTLRVDFARRLVLRRGRPVRLTPTEFRLLRCLVEHRGRPVSHADLLREVWGPEYADETANLAVYMRYLREKVEELPGEPRYLLTEWGVGYRFAGFDADPR